MNLTLNNLHESSIKNQKSIPNENIPCNENLHENVQQLSIREHFNLSKGSVPLTCIYRQSNQNQNMCTKTISHNEPAYKICEQNPMS